MAVGSYSVHGLSSTLRKDKGGSVSVLDFYQALCSRLAAIFTTIDNGRLRGHAGASRSKTGLAEAINEMLKRCSVDEWFRHGPVAGCEMQVTVIQKNDGNLPSGWHDLVKH